MPTNLKKIFIFLSCIVFFVSHSSAQTIFENNRSEVYPFLNRMAQKGLVQFDDIIQPVTRTHINQTLVDLQNIKSKLSNTEQKELAFYLEEFAIINDTNTKLDLFKNDYNKRWRSFRLQSKEFVVNGDPIIGIATFNNDGKTVQQLSNGMEMWGTMGVQKKWGYQLYYRDYTEKGNGIQNTNIASPETGKILIGANANNQINYSEIRANLSYSWKNGSISFGKDNMNWGYGENGKLVLSNKTPSYPYIRFDYTPVKWMSFNYMHAWLNSNLVDSNLSYNTYTGGVSGDTRILYTQKYLVTHSLIFKPIKGLNIALGESIIYSDKLDPGFFIPINLFKFYDNNRSNYSINAGSNGQYFLQISSRNQIKNTHLYASTFIDEIRVGEIFNKSKSRNQLGYTIGGSVTDVIVPYLTLGAEYTRINPFVYSNLIPAQTYTSYNHSLGDWMGNNFDRKIIFLKYTPLPKLKLIARYQDIRKGAAGTIVQQYLAEPQPAFLFDLQNKRKDIYLQATYEWIHNLYVRSSAQWLSETNANGLTINSTMYSLGISFGLP